MNISAPVRIAATVFAAAALLGAAPAAMAAAAGDHYSLTLTHEDVSMLGQVATGSFQLGAELTPGNFGISSFSVVIGVPGYAYDYNLPGATITFNAGTGRFGGPAHVATSFGDQLDLGSSGNWKTDDFFDPHPPCAVLGCNAFHYGSYVTAAVPEPATAGLALLGLGALAWRRRRTGHDAA